MKGIEFFKRGTVLFLVILLTLQGTLVSNASEIDFVQVPDENYQRAQQYVLIEGYLREIGLSIEDILNTNIDLTEIDPDDYNVPNIVPLANIESTGYESNIFLQSKHFATNLYGTNASNEEVIKTFLLYYVDVHDVDRNAGRVWGNLPIHYYPEYMTNEDDRVYNIVMHNLGNGKLIDLFSNAAQAANSIPNVTALPNLLNKVENIEIGIENIKSLVDIQSFGNSIYQGFLSHNGFENISDPETFIQEVNTIIDSETTYTQAEKDLLKNYTTSILSMAFGALAGIPGVGLIPIVGLYTTSMLIFTSTIYDQAILNSLAYTRNTRLGFRYLNSIGMY